MNRLIFKTMATPGMIVMGVVFAILLVSSWPLLKPALTTDQQDITLYWPPDQKQPLIDFLDVHEALTISTLPAADVKALFADSVALPDTALPVVLTIADLSPAQADSLAQTVVSGAVVEYAPQDNSSHLPPSFVAVGWLAWAGGLLWFVVSKRRMHTALRLLGVSRQTLLRLYGATGVSFTVVCIAVAMVFI